MEITESENPNHSKMNSAVIGAEELTKSIESCIKSRTVKSKSSSAKVIMTINL